MIDNDGSGWLWRYSADAKTLKRRGVRTNRNHDPTGITKNGRARMYGLVLNDASVLPLQSARCALVIILQESDELTSSFL